MSIKKKPDGLICEFLSSRGKLVVENPCPHFGWIMESSLRGDFQTTYQIIVSTSPTGMKKNGVVWNSGKVNSGNSSNVIYAGNRLSPNTRYSWKVRIWDRKHHKSKFSESQTFQTGLLKEKHVTSKYRIGRNNIKPAAIFKKAEKHLFVDFGKHLFGTLQINFSKIKNPEAVEISLGEKLIDPTTLDSAPPATIRYYRAMIPPDEQTDGFLLKLPEFEPPPRKEKPYDHIPVPHQIGNVMPFRYCEIKNYNGKLISDDIRQVAVFYPFDDSASFFESSSEVLNQVWDLCKHTIKATTYCGIYAISFFYEQLKTNKLLFNPTNSEGLIVNQNSNDNRDIIDWPEGERDHYEMGVVNIVPNAFYYQALQIMAKIAGVLKHTADSLKFMEMASSLKKTIEKSFLNRETGLFIDSLGSKHSSLHANLFPLAFGLVHSDFKAAVIELLKEKRMACSVYAAQYLLEALYLEAEEDYALQLLTSTEKRSWWNMLNSGSTMTLEAWDRAYKPNLDWNHPWGAVPANVIPRCLWGIQPLDPGFAKIQIKPQTGSLTFSRIRVPTLRGSVDARVETDLRKKFKFVFKIPANTTAITTLPIHKIENPKIFLNGSHKSVPSTGRFQSLELPSGESVVEIKSYNGRAT